MAKAYTGVDIGSNSVKLAVCQDGRPEKIIVEQLPEGIMDGARIVSFDAMADFLKELIKANGGVSKDAAVVLTAQDSLVRRLELPLMSEKELGLNLPYEFRDYISQGKDRYFYDYAVLDGVNDADGTLTGMDLLACAAPKDVINDLDNMCNRAGLRLRVALPAAAAMQDLVQTSAAAKADCCIIDFGHRATRLHFFAKGKYDVTRSIEVGGADIDRAIADFCSVDERIASGYKESNFQDCLNSQPVQDVFESIAVEVSRALNFYGFNNPEANLENAYCTGGCAQIGLLRDAVSAQTSINLLPFQALGNQLQGEEGLLAQGAAAVGATVKAG